MSVSKKHINSIKISWPKSLNKILPCIYSEYFISNISTEKMKLFKVFFFLFFLISSVKTEKACLINDNPFWYRNISSYWIGHRVWYKRWELSIWQPCKYWDGGNLRKNFITTLKNIENNWKTLWKHCENIEKHSKTFKNVVITLKNI